MFNKKIIFKILGSLLYIEGFFMMICMVMSIAMHDDDSMAFLISMLLTILSGTAMRHYGMNAENRLSRRDAYLVVTFSWILFSLYGTLPFLISGYLNSFTNAFFENMSVHHSPAAFAGRRLHTRFCSRGHRAYPHQASPAPLNKRQMDMERILHADRRMHGLIHVLWHELV